MIILISGWQLFDKFYTNVFIIINLTAVEVVDECRGADTDHDDDDCYNALPTKNYVVADDNVSILSFIFFHELLLC